MDGSTVSISQSDINCGTSEDPQSLVFNCAVVEKDQGLNSVVVEATAATSGSVSLDDGINKFDHACQNKDDGVFDSTENPNLDELPASDNSSKESTDDDPLNSVSYHRENLKASEDTQSLPGEIGNYGCPSETEVDKIIDSSGSSNLNSISGTMKSTKDEPGKVAVNEHKNNIPVVLPASPANGHVDFSGITTSTMTIPVRTIIEEVCTEPGSVSPAAVLPSALGSSDIGVRSQQGAITSPLMTSGDASTNSTGVASSNKKDPDIFPIPSVQATEENLADPSAGEAPKGKLLFSCRTQLI